MRLDGCGRDAAFEVDIQPFRIVGYLQLGLRILVFDGHFLAA